MNKPSLRIVTTLFTLSLVVLSACSRKSLPGSQWRYAPNPGVEIIVDATGTGSLLLWRSQGRTWVKHRPIPLTLTLSDGQSAQFRPERVETEGETRLIVHGQLESSTARTPARVAYTASSDGDELAIGIEATPSDAFEPERWEYTIPFQLDRHKRVYFRSDHGLDWEERHTYQFHLTTTGPLLAQPDVNEWRWFAAEQLTPDAYRIWKSESDTTAPLTLHEGRRMASYVQIYDEAGGVTLHYPQLTEGARRAIRVDAAGGATAHIALRTSAPDHAPAALPLGLRHDIILTAHPSADSLHARRDALNPQPSEPVSTELKESPFLRETPPDLSHPRYVTGGYPFPPGAVRDLSVVGVQAADQLLPVQSAPLGYWPDGSVKWAALTFPLPPDRPHTPAASQVTFRNADPLPVSIGHTPQQPSPETRLGSRLLPGGDLEITNGDFTFRFTKGEEWITARHGDRSLFSSSPSATLKFRHDLTAHAPLSLRPMGGREELQVFAVNQLTLEESGPLRAVVRLEGVTGGDEPNRLILRATFLAGRPEITFSHTVEFLFKDPRRTFLTSMALIFPLSGATSGERGIVQETYDARWSYGLDSPDESGWLELPLNGDLHLQAGIRQMAQTAPKAITQKDDRLIIELWPEACPPMDVRRYSNRPHRGQGESNNGEPDWVETHFYPSHPFVGLSRTHEIRLAFPSASNLPTLASAAADFESPPLLHPGWEPCRKAGVILPTSSEEGWPRFWQAREDLARFWLYHRELYRWYGFWNFGDFRHHFREGYGWITSPEALTAALADPNRTPPKDAPRLRDYLMSQDWAYDNGRWGWSNSEGLGNLFLQHEYLRTGNRALYFAAEAMARYCRDVVVRHDGQWLGAGTRHGVQPWSDGNHEERQTTSTEYRLHYFLSGDPRTRDVVRKLYERHYSTTRVRAEAGHSGRWGGLFFHHELTGSPEEAAQLTRYAHSFIAPQGAGLYLRPYVQFPGPKVIGSPEELNGSQMFFACYGAMHYLLEYQAAFQDEALKDAFIAMARDVIARPGKGHAIFTLPIVTFAAKHADDPAPFRNYVLSKLQDHRHWPALYQSVTADPAHWSGPNARLFTNTPGVFFRANWMPYLTSLFPNDPVWSEEIASQYDALEAQGAPLPPPPLLWRQRAYDSFTSPDGHYLIP